MNSIYFEKKDHLKKSLDDFLNNQDFYKKNSLKYYLYKTACGREKRLKQLKKVK